MSYTTRLDVNAKVTTIVVSLVLAGIAYFCISVIPEDTPVGLRILLCGVSLSPLSIIIVCYWLSPYAYDLAENALVIKRRRSPVVIPYTEILGVDYINPAFVQDFVRTGGNGGVFGYFGDFTAGGKDIYTLYVTQMKILVMVRVRDGRKLIISPIDYSLLNKLRERTQTTAQ